MISLRRAMPLPTPSRAFDTRSMWWAGPTALALVIATFVHFGLTANGAAWAVAQVVIVALAASDFATRRLPNVITIPGALVAVALRAAFERSELVEIVVAGFVSLIAFAVISYAVKGGLGMGDVKLAGFLGFLLGATAFGALLLGSLLGGVAALVLIARSSATLRTHIAYGPYLAVGAAIAILALNPPALV